MVLVHSHSASGSLSYILLAVCFYHSSAGFFSGKSLSLTEYHRIFFAKSEPENRTELPTSRYNLIHGFWPKQIWVHHTTRKNYFWNVGKSKDLLKFESLSDCTDSVFKATVQLSSLLLCVAYDHLLATDGKKSTLLALFEIYDYI